MLVLASKQTTQQGREPKFYDDVLNCRLRELLDGRKTRTDDFAKAVSISSSAVRMWYNGYSRPDMEKIPEICKFFDVSADWLLGLSDTQSVDIEMRDICKKTGLSVNALYALIRCSKNLNPDGVPNSHESSTAVERLWLINNLIEDEETLDKLSNNANLLINIRDAVENFEMPEYEGTGAVEIMKKGFEIFGKTFNFTQGQETSDFHAYMCQKIFVDFIENIPAPAYWYKGWETEVQKKSDV